MKAVLVARVSAARKVEVEVVLEYERLLKEETALPKPVTPATTTTTATTTPTSKRAAGAPAIDEPPAKRSAIQLSVIYDD